MQEQIEISGVAFKIASEQGLFEEIYDENAIEAFDNRLEKAKKVDLPLGMTSETEIKKASSNRAGLVKMKITDKNGHQRTVWVKPTPDSWKDKKDRTDKKEVENKNAITSEFVSAEKDVEGIIKDSTSVDGKDTVKVEVESYSDGSKEYVLASDTYDPSMKEMIAVNDFMDNLDVLFDDVIVLSERSFNATGDKLSSEGIKDFSAQNISAISETMKSIDSKGNLSGKEKEYMDKNTLKVGGEKMFSSPELSQSISKKIGVDSDYVEVLVGEGSADEKQSRDLQLMLAQEGTQELIQSLVKKIKKSEGSFFEPKMDTTIPNSDAKFSKNAKVFIMGGSQVSKGDMGQSVKFNPSEGSFEISLLISEKTAGEDGLTLNDTFKVTATINRFDYDIDDVEAHEDNKKKKINWAFK